MNSSPNGAGKIAFATEYVPKEGDCATFAIVLDCQSNRSFVMRSYNRPHTNPAISRSFGSTILRAPSAQIVLERRKRGPTRRSVLTTVAR